MMKLFKRYRIALVLVIFNLLLLFLLPTIGQSSIKLTRNNIKEMFMVIPPIFVLLGLLDVWIKRETMIKLLGDNSGFSGAIIAFLMGSAAAGPLYAAFPVAGVLLKKGSKLSNVLIFIGAWSTTKIPLLLFEASAMGWKFMITRLIINLIGIVIIAFVIEKFLAAEDKIDIYQKASTIN